MDMPQGTLTYAPVTPDAGVVRTAVPDQRQAARLAVNAAAVVSTVGTPSQVLDGEIRNLSEGGTQIWVPEPLPPSTLLRIDHNDSLLLGEVVYCQPELSGWLVGVQIEHALFGLAALATAMRGF